MGVVSPNKKMKNMTLKSVLHVASYSRRLGHFLLILLTFLLCQISLSSVPQKFHEEPLQRKYKQKAKDMLYLGQ